MEHVRDVYDSRCAPSGEEVCCFRLRGAGGDGGSTGAESRSSYLEMYKEKKEEKVCFESVLLRCACFVYTGFPGPLRLSLLLPDSSDMLAHAGPPTDA